ncbi:MAG: hypothetical protein PHD81_01080 [Candidatus Nanoarchaeia archaeon]|nr:hypothetical protein [Candidatus Nanoarchaeia archaeon]MDD5587684.1 hypothetical protein [Candidatus Nanoarchaeia archaeon]
MDNRDKVVIGSAILVVLAVLIVLNNTINYTTGQSMRAGYCYDTDSGDNEFARGKLSGHQYPSQIQINEVDYCVYYEDNPEKTDVLKEYYCLHDIDPEETDKNAYSYKFIVCEYGCKNGACER